VAAAISIFWKGTPKLKAGLFKFLKCWFKGNNVRLSAKYIPSDITAENLVVQPVHRISPLCRPPAGHFITF